MVKYDPWDRLVPGDIAVDRTGGTRMTVSHYQPINGESPIIHCNWFAGSEALGGDFFLHELELENARQIPYETLIVGERQEIEFSKEFQSRSMAAVLAHVSDEFHAVDVGDMFLALSDRARHALAGMTEPWFVLYFHREKTTVAFFRNLTEAVQFKLMIV